MHLISGRKAVRQDKLYDSKQTMMKEGKPYPRIDEEDGSCMIASEPIAALSELAAAALPTASEREQNPHIPKGMPQSVDKALSDIDEGEKEFERGETFTHREVMQMIWDKIACYAG